MEKFGFCDKYAKVSSNFSIIGSSVVWAPIFRRNLSKEEAVQLLSMLAETEGVYSSFRER